MTSLLNDTSGVELTASSPAVRQLAGARALDTALSVVAFDGDDTLWHNESIFSMTQERYRSLLREFVDEQELDERLLATETANLRFFGYGVKGFTLSMIETAIQVSDGRVPADIIQTIIEGGKAMVDHPVELLAGVRGTIRRLQRTYRLMLITKGDLFDQESKLARSGLADLFWRVEIVSEKDEAVYRRILTEHALDPRRFIMIGNSVRSDILPVMAAGGRAVHIPYHLTWAHERAEMKTSADGPWAVKSVRELPDLLEQILGCA
jgi:putative hydrolase of the HAD superfamily